MTEKEGSKRSGGPPGVRYTTLAAFLLLVDSVYVVGVSEPLCSTDIHPTPLRRGTLESYNLRGIPCRRHAGEAGPSRPVSISFRGWEVKLTEVVFPSFPILCACSCNFDPLEVNAFFKVGRLEPGLFGLLAKLLNLQQPRHIRIHPAHVIRNRGADRVLRSSAAAHHHSGWWVDVLPYRSTSKLWSLFVVRTTRAGERSLKVIVPRGSPPIAFDWARSYMYGAFYRLMWCSTIASGQPN